MFTVVSKWGNSLALRLPKRLADASGFTQGTKVEITVIADGTLQLRPAGPSLAQLVEQITPQNCHDEFSFGGPVGRESL